MTVTIEKNVPFTKTGTGGHGLNERWPLSKMEVGDSFALSEGDVVNLRSATGYRSRNHGVKFSVKRHGDAYRCWRVE